MRKIYLVPALVGLLTFVAAGPVAAQGAVPKQKAAQAPKAAAAGAAPAAGAPAAATTEAPSAGADDKAKSIDGFRSAKFGMGEADVRAAMIKDFNAKPDAIKAQDNASELTHSILMSVPELLPNGGTAELSYVFGYKSKSLIQVGAVWSKGTDAAITPEKLFSNANILRAHFMGEGFKPDSIAVNMPVAGGIVMFRGSDAKDRSVILLLQGTFENKDNNQRVLTPTSLLLFYVADAKSPDIFKLPPGQF
ncbi:MULTISPECIES: hypothetical protein [Bradyrhizobium]|jgi:hypothetical protein|uniref:Blr3251 protein n=1 Tax=Bradyrhizobium diazoefficiens (strain JCM 10833 / BCRC 13528 / IAM 13628 / NBRC 14792 / USDA 110) TaxID=224911 RepID=Q89Q79_BRADU|nr:hypothetical protein [Bradyrhizobium diazoefficiens]MBP1066800.1 hypothetical protein [Bradyrhizobium japonicum]AND93945.1 hypothetical protein AAV28_13290 [Bradyrhizobium diazoefficiens USDA 110]AWO90237.1 hypothetical protein DI395_18310 [Bradyrhizobium diazoefficiens]PDT63112.1 hypothetical protein CO678_01585 [Bradyrhizobium diazoefficiens]QBP27102.1 hypothetical protein Bdiaspc4_16820 [Bradyrhizobium diazoefficiens]